MCTVIEAHVPRLKDRALTLQIASYGELRRLSNWHVKYCKTRCVIVGHVCTFVERHAMGMQAVVLQSKVIK